MAEAETDARRLATEARDRVRFEEEALELADQVYRVARRLVSTPRGGRRSRPGDVRARLSQLALLHARHEPPRLAHADPDEPQHRPRPAGAALARHAADGGRRLLPLQPPRGGGRRRRRASASSSGSRRTRSSRRSRTCPHDFRDVIVLVDIGDFSYQDAAQILDIPIGTVMSRLHRGRRILKRRARGDGGRRASRDGVRARSARSARSCSSRTSTAS